MVIDDEADLLAMTTKMLKKNDFEVYGFNNPVKALAHIKDNGCKDFSIVISNVRMPGMSGFELVRKIRDLCPDIRIILMTVFEINMAEAQIVLPSTKVDAFLNKPFNPAELIHAIKECGKKR
jgi:DNA-binding NtrC family response regulator